MQIYHKTYETIIKIILKNGFEIAGYIDCFPTKKSKKLFSEGYKKVSKEPFFCVWKLKNKNAASRSSQSRTKEIYKMFE